MIKAYYYPLLSAVTIVLDKEAIEQLELVIEAVKAGPDELHLIHGMEHPYGVDLGELGFLEEIQVREIHIGGRLLDPNATQ